MEFTPAAILSVLSIIAILAGFIKWTASRIISVVQDNAAGEARLQNFESTLKINKDTLVELSGALQEHMATEEDVSEKISSLVDELNESNQQDHEQLLLKLDALATAGLESAIGVIRSIHTTDVDPTMIYKIVPEGERDPPFECIWHNEAWTEWTGLSLSQSQSGGDMRAITEAEYPVVEADVTRLGQEKMPMDVFYTMVRPLEDDEVVGKVWAHAYPIHTSNELEWYYVSKLRMMEPSDWFRTHVRNDPTPPTGE